MKRPLRVLTESLRRKSCETYSISRSRSATASGISPTSDSPDHGREKHDKADFMHSAFTVSISPIVCLIAPFQYWGSLSMIAIESTAAILLGATVIVLYGKVKRLRTRVNLLEKIYDSRGNGFIFLSSDGRITAGNPSATKSLRRGTITGLSVDDLFETADAVRLRAILDSLSSSGSTGLQTFTGILKTAGAAGSRLELTVEFDHDSGGFLLSQVRMVDADSMRDYESNLRKIEPIMHLASSLTHDLNNLLGTILGYSSLLKRRLETGSKEFHFAEIIETSSRETADLIKKVLGFSNLDAKTVRNVEFVGFVRDIMEQFMRGHDDRFTFTFESSVEHITARLSTFQMKQVIESLLENAIESMEGGGSIFVRVGLTGDPAKTPESIDGPFCFAEVEDTGIGIDDGTLHRIFEPFFSTKKMKKYTGLGLSAAFSIMKHHRGNIRVYSTTGKGTRVRFILPCQTEDINPVAGDVRIVRAGGKPRVLVVDDEENVRKLGVDILSENGFYVETANDGRQALDRLHKGGEFDLVILDMIMPVMGGKEACIEIKKLKNPPSVLICTGYSQLSDLESILEKSADGLLQKPYTTSELLEAVDRIVAR